MYALITDALEFIRYVDAPTRTKPGYSIVPVTRVPKSPLDKATQKYEFYRTVTADDVTEGYSIVAKTRRKQDAYTEEQAHEVTKTNLRNWYKKFEAGNATETQVQSALAWIIRDFYKDEVT